MYMRSKPRVSSLARMLQMTKGMNTGRNAGGAIRKITVSLIGAAALAAGLVLLRQGNARAEPVEAAIDEVPPGESVPGKIRLDKLRELGI